MGFKTTSKTIEELFVPSARKSCIVEIDGIPAYQIRHKFHRAIRRRGDSATGLYGILNCIFTENAIRENFTLPNVWLLNHNAIARKRNITEESRMNHLRKQDTEGFRLHSECRRETSNRSAIRVVRDIRALQRLGM